MGRNNADFQDQVVYHASWRHNQSSIEENGIEPNQPWDDQPKGVYVSKGPATTKGYGDDVYEIKLHPEDELVEDTMERGAYVLQRHVPTSDFKRVGHVFTDRKTGLSQVHMHKAEDCDGKSIYG